MPGPTISMTWTVEAAEDGNLTGSWTGAAPGQSYTREMSDISVDGDAFSFKVRIEDQGETGRRSGRPVSNRRPSAWEADALPTELRPRAATSVMGREGLEPPTSAM